ncbi:MAG: carbohydrate binding domain-containing protein [Bacteroidales bacterium]|nr:carbohydrate binding domain-containing protein [Candidatus Colicola faecequi]
MNMKKLLIAALALLALASCSTQPAPEGAICIDVKHPVCQVNPDMYGIFFEDINYAADGGLYAELVKNRSFEFPDRLMGWTAEGNVSVTETSPFDKNPHALRMEDASSIRNEGFFGMGLLEGEKYRFSVWARSAEGEEAMLRLSLLAGEDNIAEASVSVSSAEWQKYTAVLTASQTAKGQLKLSHDGAAVEIDHVSLFPENTFNGHENGMRADLAQALADLHPGVFRFPGGCIIEGNTLATRYQWKNTVGPVENRPLNENRWRNSMGDRPAPDYFQSYGLGFYEYFLLAEEIGAQPLPVLNCGMACEFANDPTTEGEWLVPLDELQPYVDDALDLIEFANGDPATNKWAAIRAEMGHPAPFGLKYLAVGNEQWGEFVSPRLKMFSDQIRAKYPDIQLVGTAGASPEGEMFDYMWGEMRKLESDLVDEHFYNSPEWFLGNACRYDDYPRTGPKVFAGEYACHAHGLFHSVNCFWAALCEAAFMTGLERNADVVRLATYAPLFGQVEGWQWRPDLIWFDPLHTYRTASYYVQQLYSCNKGTDVLPTVQGSLPVAGQDSLYASAVYDAASKEVIVKLVNVSAEEKPVTLHFDGLRGSHKAAVTRLSAGDEADNIGLEEELVAPRQLAEPLRIAANTELSVPARTFQIIRFKK